MPPLSPVPLALPVSAVLAVPPWPRAPPLSLPLPAPPRLRAPPLPPALIVLPVPFVPPPSASRAARSVLPVLPWPRAPPQVPVPPLSPPLPLPRDPPALPPPPPLSPVPLEALEESGGGRAPPPSPAPRCESRAAGGQVPVPVSVPRGRPGAASSSSASSASRARSSGAAPRAGGAPMARCGRCRRCRSAPRRRPRAPAGAGPTPCGIARRLKEPPLPPRPRPALRHLPQPRAHGHAGARMREARSACTRVHNTAAVCASTDVQTRSPGCAARGLHGRAHTRTLTHARVRAHAHAHARPTRNAHVRTRARPAGAPCMQLRDPDRAGTGMERDVGAAGQTGTNWGSNGNAGTVGWRGVLGAEGPPGAARSRSPALGTGRAGTAEPPGDPQPAPGDSAARLALPGGSRCPSKAMRGRGGQNRPGGVLRGWGGRRRAAPHTFPVGAAPSFPRAKRSRLQWVARIPRCPTAGKLRHAAPPSASPPTRCPPPRGSRQQLGEGGPGPSLNYKCDRPLSEPLCGVGGGPRAQLLPSEAQKRSGARAALAGLQNPPPPKQRPSPRGRTRSPTHGSAAFFALLG